MKFEKNVKQKVDFYAYFDFEAYSRRFVHLSVSQSVRPVPCPTNNFKTTVDILIKLGI